MIRKSETRFSEKIRAPPKARSGNRFNLKRLRSKTGLFFVEFVFFDLDLAALRAGAALEELRRVTRLAWLSRFSGFAAGTFAGIAADLVLQFEDIDKLIGLPPQFVGHHRRLRGNGGYDHDADAAPLYRLDQAGEIAVAGEQDHLIDMRRNLHGIDRKLDVHVALDLAPTGLVDEFLGRFGDDGIAVVVEPIDQRPDGRIFLILDHGCVIEGAQQIAARLELAQQPLVVDVKAERFRRGVQVGAVNK